MIRTHVRRIAMGAMLAVAVATLLVVAGRGPDVNSAAGRDYATPSLMRPGLGPAVLLAGPDASVERVSVSKLRSFVLVGSLGMAALVSAGAVWRAPTGSRSSARRNEARRIPVPRGPPPIGPARP